MKNLTVKAIVLIGMMSSISYILMLLEFPLPPFPNFLKVDFSDIPALITALILGPGAGILVEFVKNVLDYFMTGSETGVPVGHISNFVAGVLFIVPAYYIYQKLRTNKGMTFALIAATVIMSLIMSVLNYFVFLPLYTMFLNFPAMSAQEARQMIVAGILPFNIVKGVIISIVFMLLFAKMGAWIAKQRTYGNA